MILTTDEVKQHLRLNVDDGTEDELLELLILQAQTAAADFTRVDWETVAYVPETVRLAVLLMVSHLYEYRDSSDKAAYSTMMDAFHALLYPNRDVEQLF